MVTGQRHCVRLRQEFTVCVIQRVVHVIDILQCDVLSSFAYNNT